MTLARNILASLTLLAFPLQVTAEAPKVVTDILPIHSLVSMVMEGVGTPTYLVPPGQEPHKGALRPQDAQSLRSADMVVWLGPDMSGWLEKPVTTLAPDAENIVLLDVENLTLLPSRHGAFLAGDHDDHNHGDHDPHAWLSPKNAAVWAEHVGEKLAKIDPENAETYAANAANAVKILDAAKTAAKAELNAVEGGTYAVYHDAYQYFEESFGVSPLAAVTEGDGTEADLARIQQVRSIMKSAGLLCFLAPVNSNTKLVTALTEGDTIRVVRADQFGSTLTPGPSLYPEMILDLALAHRACLTPS